MRSIDNAISIKALVSHAGKNANIQSPLLSWVESCLPPKDVEVLIPVNVTLFGIRVFADD